MKRIVSGVLFSMVSTMACAHTLLRIGISESDSPPVSIISENRLVGGILKELGEAMARELGAKPEFIIIPRKRVDSFAANDKIQIICNINSIWKNDADKFHWTKEIYSQVERVVSLKAMRDIGQVSDLAGKRISTARGFNYPTLDPIWASNKALREDESKLEFMLRAVQKNLSDVAIVSEMEFAYWAKQHPEQALLFKKHPVIISSMPTMCAVEKNSPITVDELNQAIDRLHQSPKFKELLNNYLM